jgi:hypothetical protein
MTGETVPHQDSVAIEIDAGPAQAKDFAAAHPGEKAD